MARPRTINRERVMECAEQLVQRDGALALTLDAVAREAGITKGGLQYCFGSKDDLITALIDRWIAAFDTEVQTHTPPDATPADKARAYVQVCAQMDDATRARIAGTLITLLQSPDHLKKIRDWYAGWLTSEVCHSDEARQMRTMIFAAEGAFFLRSFGFITMQDVEWQAAFADIQTLMVPAGPAEPAKA
ncbi:TetR/AcrR family transcriptional regulator [Acetobacter persici]|uniref:TetR family transcriptional regulator n=1 Tax=Acetobacter persici TaxID=1076596 RepID=A0A1U9LDU7_9PROT|nr:TetR/AcrR family transcriptional regulator [Acetobacter persici]AQT04611.1 TetR family transcriptional regulator [Acetobacter persici]